jgi:lysophospholipase L1-like esterase
MKHAFTIAVALSICQMASFVRADDRPAAKIKVACVGDSITAGAGIKDPKMKYPTQLQGMLGDGYVVKNFGVSGRTMLKHGDFPIWKEKAYHAAKDFGPDVVIIKLGTNDTKPQNWKFKDEFAADAKAMVQEFQNLPSKPKVYLCHPVPAFPGNFGIRDEVIKNEVIPAVDQVAKETGAGVIDLYTALADHKDLFPDKVHPNDAGATLMAQAIHKAIAAEKVAPKR